MRRKGLLATLTLGAIALATVGWTQDTNQAKTKPGNKKELIAWTQDQQAHPVPQTQVPNTATQQQPSVGQEAEKQPAAQAFTGMIMKSGDTYVLQTADNVTYQLDDQQRAKEYEGKQVQVTGSLDKSANMIKVRDIKQTA
jgi:uncharacterized protein DUF5818